MTGSANIQGEWWGRRAMDWSTTQETTAMPLYRAAVARLGIGAETRVLDVGCGAGLFCQLASDRGATVEGVDASEPLVEIARRRAPAGRFFVGDMETLPVEDGSFDVVTGFNSFQYAVRPARALAEAARAVRRGGSVFVATWGDPAECEALAYVDAVGSFLPPPPPETPGPLALSDPEALRAFVREAGLAPREVADVDMPFVYADLETALRGTLSAGPAVRAIDRAGEASVRDAVAKSLAPFRLSSGAYRLENRFRYLIADGGQS
jgi:SAM-dependent methyltransferase